MDNILYFVIIFLLIMLVIASYYAVRFALIILRTQDQIEDSLDELDVSFDNLNKFERHMTMIHASFLNSAWWSTIMVQANEGVAYGSA